MSTIYRIRKWNDLFENNRSRQVTKLAWVSIPNRHDGEGYAIVMSQDDAAEIFTAWILMLQLTSRCHPRGSLVRDDGTTMTPEIMAIKTRGKAAWFKRALELLSSPEVGWIESSIQERETRKTSVGRQSRVTRASVACEEQNRTEGNRTEYIHTPSAKPTSVEVYSVKFLHFWKLYPKKEAKGEAWKAWVKMKCEQLENEIEHALAWQVNSRKWKDGYIPQAARYLRGQCWEDEPEKINREIKPKDGSYITAEEAANVTNA